MTDEHAATEERYLGLEQIERGHGAHSFNR